MSSTRKDKRLYDASKDGDINQVRKLLNEGANVNYSQDNQTILHCAAMYGHDAVVELLLSAGAFVNSRDYFGNTPLHCAALHGHHKRVELLLKAGASVDARNNIERTPLHEAALNGHDKAVELLLNAGASVDSKDNWAITPLHCASWNGHEKVVALLLYAGAFADSRTTDNQTPLYRAAKEGKYKVVELLLNAGAFFDTRENDNQTLLDCVVENGHEKVVELLLKADASTDSNDNTAQPPAPTEETMSSSNSSIEGKAIYNPTNNQRAALVTAVQEGSISGLLSFLERGVDPNLTDETGDTLLHLAIKANPSNIVDILLHATGINVTLTNQDGLTPQVLSIKLGHRGITKSIYDRSKKPFVDVPDSAITIHYDQDSLGCGAAGIVYKGEYNKELVAVKTPRTNCEDILIDEISTMTRCPSPYIVDIVAISRRENNRPMLALQFMDCGDLRTYLDAKRSGRETRIDVSSLQVAWVVSNALADLHHNGILHRDLKSQNILLSTKHYIKLGDLGISREYARTMTTGVGTPYWEAPEVMASGKDYDYAADIYSFGVILTELDTLQLPYAGLGLTHWDIMDRVRRGSLRPSVSNTCEPWLKKLADMCLAFDPKQRPTAQAIVDLLRDQLHHPNNAWLSHASESGPETLPAKPQTKWTQIPCKTCNALNSIRATRCIQCSSLMRSASENLSILLKRVDVVKKKGVDISTTIECPMCYEEYNMNTTMCELCNEELPLKNDVEKLEELAKQFDMISVD